MTRRVTFTDNVEVHHDVYIKCTESETLRTLKYFEPLIDCPVEKQMRPANGCSKVYLKYSQKENYGVRNHGSFVTRGLYSTQHSLCSPISYCQHSSFSLRNVHIYLYKEL